MSLSAVAALLLATAPAVAPAAAADLAVVNTAKRPVTRLWLSPAPDRVFGAEVRAGLPLAPGARLVIPSDGSTCGWGLHVEFSNGARTQAQVGGACNNGAVRIGDATAYRRASNEPHLLGFVNRSGRDVIGVRFFVNGGAPDGIALDGTFADGTGTDLGYRGACEIRMQVRFADGATEERAGLNGCGSARFVVGPGWLETPDAQAHSGGRVPVPGGTLQVVNSSETEVLAGLRLRRAGTAGPGTAMLAEPLPVMGRAEVAFDHGGHCRWTMRTEPRGAPPREKDLDLCNALGVIVWGGTQVAEELVASGVTNMSREPIVQLFAAPLGGQPGPDLMRGRALPFGQTMDLPPPVPGQCLYVLTAKLRSGAEVSDDGANLCQSAPVSLPH